jgi:hypothetical protein
LVENGTLGRLETLLDPCSGHKRGSRLIQARHYRGALAGGGRPAYPTNNPPDRAILEHTIRDLKAKVGFRECRRCGRVVPIVLDDSNAGELAAVPLIMVVLCG